MNSKALTAILAFGLLAAGHLWFYSHMEKYSAKDDPDFYYHLAIGRETAQTGLIRALPQVEDIGWNRYYPDKDFLFHMILAGAHRLDGIQGQLLMRAVFGIALLLVLFLAGMSMESPFVVAAIIGGVVLLTPQFMVRECALRSYVLAQASYFFLLLGLLKKKGWIVFFGGFIYVLTYSAFFMPLALILLAGFWPAQHNSIRKKLLRMGIFGVVGGSLIHPYFPSNLIMGTITWKIATQTKIWGEIGSGQENYPLPILAFLRNYSFHLLILLMGAIEFLRIFRRRSWHVEGEFCCVFIACLGYWALGLVSGRALEYSVPLTAILAIQISRKIRGARNRMGTGAGFAFLVLALQVPIARIGFDPIPHGSADAAFAAIAKIPKNAAGKKVFSCEWSTNAYLFYARPDLRLVDMVDPFYLFEVSPEKIKLRALFQRGQIKEPNRLIREVFGGNYVLCSARGGIALMEKNPGFKRLFPDHPELSLGVPFLYELR